MIKLLVLFLKVKTAVILGILVSFFYLQDDPWLKRRLEVSLSRSYTALVGEPFSLEIRKLNLVTGEIQIASVACSSSKGDWSFFCEQILIQFSWLKGLATEITCRDAQIASCYDQGKLAIEDPFYTIVNAPSRVPLTTTAVFVNAATAVIASPSANIKIVGSSSTHFYQESTVTRLSCGNDSSIHVKGKLLEESLFANSVSGTILIKTPSGDFRAGGSRADSPGGSEVVVNLDGDFPFLHDIHKRCRFFCSYKDGKASCLWYPPNQKEIVKGENIRFIGDTLVGTIEVQGGLKNIAPYILGSPAPLEGSCSFHGEVSVTQSNDYSYKGDLAVKDFASKGMCVPLICTSVVGDQKKAEGAIKIEGPACLQGNWNYDYLTTQFTSSLALTGPLKDLPKVVIEKGHCSLVYQDEKLRADYTLSGTYLEGKKAFVSGSVESDFATATLHGLWNNNLFLVKLGLGPLEPLALQYSTAEKKVIDLEKADGILKGTVDFDYIKESVRLYSGYDFQGKATLGVEADLTGPKLHLKVATKDAHIKLPLTHNCIKELAASVEFDPSKNSLVVSDLSVGLSKGKLTSSKLLLSFNEDGGLTYAHIPLTCSSLFVSWDKDIFGLLHGGLTATFKKGRWLCQGMVNIDKAHVRGNLLSAQVQRTVGVSSLPIDLDIQLSTLTPIQVKTPFFETEARIDGSVKGTCADPQITGSLELLRGSLFFPYKSLYITKGKMVISPHQPDDPTIELVAKNKLKKYAITMRVTGSVQQPKITFESVPQLSEEAIMTLLLTGSEEASFYLAMSHVAVMHIKSILFGNAEHLSDAQKFFKGLFKPLKNVRIVPKVTDQKGLEGSIEVDINDRLRAKAHNNVTLSDETQLEVEYALSDDMSVKAVRDEQGSIGGELEMKWKF